MHELPISPPIVTAMLPQSRHHRFLLVLAAWTAAGLLIAGQLELQLSLRGQDRAFWAVVLPSLVGCWVWALYTPALAALTRRLRRYRAATPERAPWRGWALCLALHICAGTLVTLADSAVWASVVPLLDGRTTPWSSRFAATLLTNACFYVAVAALTEAADYAALSNARAREAAVLAERAAALQTRLHEARLHALQAQLRPHFLYNTLNMIAELVYEAPDRADAMLMHLGRLLRRGIGAGPDAPHLVPLAEEMAFVRAYGALLAERFGKRVRFTTAMPAAAGPCLVPAYALQPLVENAFRHGARHHEGTTAVTVAAALQSDTLIVRVSDRALDSSELGPATAAIGAPDAFDDSAEGVGLRNTRERLAALFGPAAGLTLARAGAATTATLRVPRTDTADAVASGAAACHRVATDMSAHKDDPVVTPHDRRDATLVRAADEVLVRTCGVRDGQRRAM